MTRYIIRRVLIAIPVLWGIVTITFFMAELMPGDYVDALFPPERRLREGITEEQIAKLRVRYGLDRPVAERYLIWLRELALRGNLGYSFRTREPILKQMVRRLPATLQLTLASMAFSLITGTVLGIISAVKQYSLLDNVLSLVGLVWISTPQFVFALMGLYLFSLRIPLFPTGGRGPAGEQVGLFTRIHHMILPVIVLGLGGVASYMRYTRSSILEVLNQDYVTVARAKGVREKIVLVRHALRNALLPLITIVGMRLPGLLGGAFLIEFIFVWPGMATYSMTGINFRDHPVLMGMNFVSSSLVLLANLVTDVAYAWVDPRIRYE